MIYVFLFIFLYFFVFILDHLHRKQKKSNQFITMPNIMDSKTNAEDIIQIARLVS